MPKSTWSIYKKKWDLGRPPPWFSKIPTFSCFFFGNVPKSRQYKTIYFVQKRDCTTIYFHLRYWSSTWLSSAFNTGFQIRHSPLIFETRLWCWRLLGALSSHCFPKPWSTYRNLRLGRNRTFLGLLVAQIWNLIEGTGFLRGGTQKS